MPGDPGRSERIASHFDDARRVRSNREYTTYTGELDGVAVSVCSTGIGGPSAAIAVEELCNIGTDTLIRVGTCGAIDTTLRIGDLVVCQAAVRNEGTSHQYAPAVFPAIAHLDVVTALRDAAIQLQQRFRVGIVTSSDSLYGELEGERMPVSEQIRRQTVAAERFGCLAAEMECAAVFVAAQVRRVRAGAVVGVVNAAGDPGSMPQSADKLPIDSTIESAVAALRILISRDLAAAQPTAGLRADGAASGH